MCAWMRIRSTIATKRIRAKTRDRPDAACFGHPTRRAEGFLLNDQGLLGSSALWACSTEALGEAQLRLVLLSKISRLRGFRLISILQARKPYIGMDHFKGGGSQQVRFKASGRPR